MQKYCVYIHRRLTDSVIFYVGMGDKDRPNTFKNRNKHWHNTVNKHGRSVEVLFKNLTKEDAIELEIFLISLIGRKDLNKGTLINKTDGGEGALGVIMSEETKQKMRKPKSEEHRLKLVANIKKRNKDLWKGVSKTTEHRDKISKKMQGIVRSEETRQKMSKAKGKPVINIETGDVYGSVKIAAESCGLSYTKLGPKLSGYGKNNTPFRYLDQT